MFSRLKLTIGLICLTTLLVACHNNTSNKRTNGYIEGRYTYISTNSTGILEKLYVRKGHLVSKGQLLFSLEAEPQQSELKIAEEGLKQAVANHGALKSRAKFDQSTLKRYEALALANKNAVEKNNLDELRTKAQSSLAELNVSEANIAAKTAALAQAKWARSQKNGTAPLNGMVFDIYYRKGENTLAQKPIMSLLAPENIKAVFYIPEYDLAKIKLNGKIRINCDNCRTLYLAKISYISPSAEYTPPIIYSSETNSTLVFRVEADLSPNDAYHLHPGQPIYITYEST